MVSGKPHEERSTNVLHQNNEISNYIKEFSSLLIVQIIYVNNLGWSWWQFYLLLSDVLGKFYKLRLMLRFFASLFYYIFVDRWRDRQKMCFCGSVLPSHSWKFRSSDRQTHKSNLELSKNVASRRFNLKLINRKLLAKLNCFLFFCYLDCRWASIFIFFQRPC